MNGRSSTHDVQCDPDRGMVVKRYRACPRGEHVREWNALRLLARHAPGLAPAPVSADLDAVPPVITMSWLPGTELGRSPVTAEQAGALVTALERLWSVRGDLPAVTPGPVVFAARVRAIVAADPALGDDPEVLAAYATAKTWLQGWAADPHAQHTAFGQGDPSPPNFLWDSTRIRLIDFEDSGPSSRAFELAILVEHLANRPHALLDADRFPALFGLTRGEQAQLRDFRRLAALFWLFLLRPGGPASERNPPETLPDQAGRLLGLLGLTRAP